MAYCILVKGKILKFSGAEVIVLSDTLKYEKIKLKPQMELGQVIYYFEEDILHPKVENVKKSSLLAGGDWMKHFLKAAPVLLIVLAFILVRPPFLENTPYGVVSIDINPSISLHVDHHGIVTHSQGENNDGKRVLSLIDITNQPLSQAIETILINAIDQGYLTEDKQVFIATAERDKQQTILAIVDKTLDELTIDDSYSVFVADLDYDLTNAAKDNDQSLGYYYLDQLRTDKDEDLIDPTLMDTLQNHQDINILKERPAKQNIPLDKKMEKEDRKNEHKQVKEDKNEDKKEKRITKSK